MTVIASCAVKGRKLKIVFGELVGLVGGLEASAAFCRVSKSTLARYASASPADAGCFAPIDVVRDLEALSGEPLVTAALATMADGVFVAVPSTPPSTAGLHMMLASLSQEFGEATHAVCTGLADGEMSAADVERAVPQIDDVIRVAAALRAVLLAGETK